MKIREEANQEVINAMNSVAKALDKGKFDFTDENNTKAFKNLTRILDKTQGRGNRQDADDDLYAYAKDENNKNRVGVLQDKENSYLLTKSIKDKNYNSVLKALKGLSKSLKSMILDLCKNSTSSDERYAVFKHLFVNEKNGKIVDPVKRYTNYGSTDKAFSKIDSLIKELKGDLKTLKNSNTSLIEKSCDEITNMIFDIADVYHIYIPMVEGYANNYRPLLQEGITMRNRKFSLRESDDLSVPEIGMDNGVASLLIEAIHQTWDFIDFYNSAIATISENSEYVDIVNMLNELANEENMHIGQLQKALEIVSPNAISIDTGRMKAENDFVESKRKVSGKTLKESDDELGESLYQKVRKAAPYGVVRADYPDAIERINRKVDDTNKMVQGMVKDNADLYDNAPAVKKLMSETDDDTFERDSKPTYTESKRVRTGKRFLSESDEDDDLALEVAHAMDKKKKSFRNSNNGKAYKDAAEQIKKSRKSGNKDYSADDWVSDMEKVNPDKFN